MKDDPQLPANVPAEDENAPLTLRILTWGLAYHGIRHVLGALLASVMTNPAYTGPLKGLVRDAVREALYEAEVLTEGNVHESAGLYARVSETVGQELEARGLHKPPAP